ncbi:MAG TPA: glycosyltransferase family 4 protein [Thermoanaerobaculia bacterium]|jgi:glycosyltransferase involved in cell wall biosynthesis|nr:glycosyltransferase family 4 protein [Thermoanaerobaculia bacterium]
MKILTMADLPPDPNAGASGAEYETIAALRRLGHEVDDVWRDAIAHKITHGNLHIAFELPKEYERIASERLLRGSYDIVHVNQPHGYRVARLVRRHFPRTAFIHRSHGWESMVREVLGRWRQVYPSESRGLTRRAASALLAPFIERHDREIVKWADGHIVGSTAEADFLRERNGVDAARIGVITQAPPALYNATPAAPMDANRLATVLHVAQFAFFKAPMIVAAAMNRIAERRPDARFVWVSGRENHDAIAALLSPAVRSRIELLGWMPQDALLRVYDRAGIFLFPSFFEGAGKVHIEALSRGLCVVASRAGGMRDYIQDGVNGFLVDPGRADSLADAALAAMADPDRASVVSAAAARTARELSWDRAARETAAFYSQRLAAKLASSM